MKVTDYIIKTLIKYGVKHTFGYPGGVICHFMDSISKCQGITAHVTYNEQGAAFAACGYAQASRKLCVAFSTSGPGATNLVTGIANAFFDSIPVLFITGQVDTYALNQTDGIRQKGFQETNVVDMVKPITKYAVRIDKPDDILFYLDKAVSEATNDNPGPVLLDIPADIQRAEIFDCSSDKRPIGHKDSFSINIESFIERIRSHKRPVLLLGNGVKLSNSMETLKRVIEKWNIPVVTSLPAFDILPFNHNNYFGFIGTNGQRYANFVFGKADIIISIGSRLDTRQIGLNRSKYFRQKELIRIDIDSKQLEYKVVENETSYCVDAKDFVSMLNDFDLDFSIWNNTCRIIKERLIGYDDQKYNILITKISETLPLDCAITLDVGQNQIWFAQSSHLIGQSVYMSAGHGSMGYSLPASIGVYYATGKEVYCFNGDGGLMMNIQELQFIKKEKLPIKVICLNNYALGMIRGFQERNFNKNYFLTTESSGWQSPDFRKIAIAFDMPYLLIETCDDVAKIKAMPNGPAFIEIRYRGETSLIPNFGKGDLIQDQLPPLDRDIFEELMKL